MNLHVPQTEQAKAEALHLLGTRHNLVTPRHGEPLITATQDFISTCYLLTNKDVFYDRSTFQRICSYFCNDSAHRRIHMPHPAIYKPMRLWTGKQVFSMLLRADDSIDDEQQSAVDTADDDYKSTSISLDDPSLSSYQDTSDLNLELPERNYTKRGGCMCARDGYVVFRRSQLMCGNLCKTSVGGDKQGMLYALIRNKGSAAAVRVLNRIARLSARWIGERGFSIGIDDVTPSEALTQQKKQMVRVGYASCQDKIDQYTHGKLEPISGCDPQQTLESLCLGELSKIREDFGKRVFARVGLSQLLAAHHGRVRFEGE